MLCQSSVSRCIAICDAVVKVECKSIRTFSLTLPLDHLRRHTPSVYSVVTTRSVVPLTSSSCPWRTTPPLRLSGPWSLLVGQACISGRQRQLTCWMSSEKSASHSDYLKVQLSQKQTVDGRALVSADLLDQENGRGGKEKRSEMCRSNLEKALRGKL